MKFSIQRHEQNRPFRIPGTWTVIVDNAERRVLDELCFDEMLGAVARLLLNSYQPWGRWGSSPWVWERKPVAWQIDIEQCDDGPANSMAHFCIHRAETFSGELRADECLGFIAAYCLTDGAIQLFSGLKTYEQTIASQHWLRDHTPVAFLESRT